jgi:hypothetical protein
MNAPVSPEIRRVLCFGDVVGKPGRELLISLLGKLKIEYGADFVIANAENAAGGTSINPDVAAELHQAGVNVITLGDHAWHKQGMDGFLERNAAWCIRPANFPEAPGKGFAICDLGAGQKLAVLNLMGRVFMNSLLDCPFRTAERVLGSELASAAVKICDFHAEATSEKYALARYLDGRVSLIFGTHTHVPTADEQILPGGTAYISDLGMCGPLNSVLGMDSDVAVKRFLTGMNYAYNVASGPAVLHGLCCDIDSKSGKALKVLRLKIAA